MHDVNKFFWDESYLYCSCADGIIHRCVPEIEMSRFLELLHSLPVGGNHSGIRTAHKILHCGYYWATIHQDSHHFAKSYDCCQREGGISKRKELPMNPIMVIELFDIWVTYFMEPFVSPYEMKYILIAVDI